MSQRTPSRASLLIMAMLTLGLYSGTPGVVRASAVTEAPDGSRDVDGDPETYDNGGPGRMGNNMGNATPDVSRVDAEKLDVWNVLAAVLRTLVTWGPAR